MTSSLMRTSFTLGDDGTSIASILPSPTAIDPTGQSGDPIQIDSVVRLWTRQGASDAEESLQIQIQTIPSLPEPLPASVLAFSTDETVGFSHPALREVARHVVALAG